MEVKIKQGNEMLDATIEMVDGVMVVSPKVEKFEPKDGDVVFQDGRSQWVFIYKDCSTAEAYEYVSLRLSSCKISFPNGYHIGYVNTLRPATEEEKQKLFDKLKEEGWEWDAEKKEVIKLRWMPKEREIYFYPSFSHSCFVSNYLKWDNDSIDEGFFKRGWYFKTEEECQEFCDRLNDAINSVKP